MSFRLGRVVSTRSALCEVNQLDVLKALSRHARGDWGDLEQDDKAANDRALKEGTRILSSYKDSADVKFWIITEGDRSATTVLLPSDY